MTESGSIKIESRLMALNRERRLAVTPGLYFGRLNDPMNTRVYHLIITVLGEPPFYSYKVFDRFLGIERADVLPKDILWGPRIEQPVVPKEEWVS